MFCRINSKKQVTVSGIVSHYACIIFSESLILLTGVILSSNAVCVRHIFEVIGKKNNGREPFFVNHMFHCKINLWKFLQFTDIAL